MGRPYNLKGSLKKVQRTNGEWVWRGRYRIYGVNRHRQKCITLGAVKDMTQKRAQAILESIVHRDNKNIDGAKILSGKPSPMAVPESMASAKSRQRGAIGVVSELLVCSDLLSRGIEAYRAVNPQAPFDLVCYSDGKYFSVEVKTAHRGEGSNRTCVNIRNNTGQFDILAVVNWNGKIHYVSAGEVSGLHRVVIDKILCDRCDSNFSAISEIEGNRNDINDMEAQ